MSLRRHNNIVNENCGWRDESSDDCRKQAVTVQTWRDVEMPGKYFQAFPHHIKLCFVKNLWNQRPASWENAWCSLLKYRYVHKRFNKLVIDKLTEQYAARFISINITHSTLYSHPYKLQQKWHIQDFYLEGGVNFSSVIGTFFSHCSVATRPEVHQWL